MLNLNTDMFLMKLGNQSFLHEVTSVYSKYEENFSSTKPKISK